MNNSPPDKVHAILHEIFLQDKNSKCSVCGAYDINFFSVCKGHSPLHVPIEHAVAIFKCVKWLGLRSLPYEVTQDAMKLECYERSPTLLDYMDRYIKERCDSLPEWCL